MKTSKNQLHTVIKTIPQVVEPVSLFAHLTNAGNKEGCVFYENTTNESKFAGLSIGVTQASLVISGKKSEFQIRALDPLGQKLLSQVISQLPESATILQQSEDAIIGILHADLSQYVLEERLTASNHTQLLRILNQDIVFPETFQQDLPLGLFGCFAYDFIRQFEDIPEHQADLLGEPDYIFYFSSQAFVIDHQQQQTHFVNLYLENNAACKQQAEQNIQAMQTASQLDAFIDDSPCQLGEMQTDTDFETYQHAVSQIMQAVHQGDAFQVVYGRTMFADFEGSPLNVFATLRRINPSPYMFYMRDHQGSLLGASPELALRVTTDAGQESRTIEIHPIAGTKPRGLINDKVDVQLDQRLALAMQTDPKELAEHAMLIDLARNDIASIAKPGTTRIVDALNVEKFAHVQHLTSRVQGKLLDNMDALTAYIATMNMGTLTGAPKPSALRLIAKYEKNARGYFGGGFGFLTHTGELETCIVIRSIRCKNGKAFIRAGGGIVADSIISNEFAETEHKARSCMKALQQSVTKELV